MSDQLQEPLRTLLRNRLFVLLWLSRWKLLLDRLWEPLQVPLGSSLRDPLEAQLKEDWANE